MLSHFLASLSTKVLCYIMLLLCYTICPVGHNHYLVQRYLRATEDVQSTLGKQSNLYYLVRLEVRYSSDEAIRNCMNA